MLFRHAGPSSGSTEPAAAGGFVVDRPPPGLTRGKYAASPLAILALGAALKAGDAETYLKLATKKFSRLRKAAKTFAEIQPEVSSHTNFQMAALSLSRAVSELGGLIAGAPPEDQAGPDAGSSGTA